MKKIVFFLMSLIIVFTLKSQTYSESIVACDKSFSTKSELLVDNSIKILIVNDADTSRKDEFTIKTNDLELFAKIFKIHFLKVDSSCDSLEKEKLLVIGRKFFLNVIAANVRDSSSPVAGVLKAKSFAKAEFLYRNINKSGKIKSFSRTANWVTLRIIKVRAEINNGFIQNLKAYIEFPDSSVRYFILPFPVGISSVGNFKTYYNTRLIELGSPLYSKAPSRKEKLRLIEKMKNDSSLPIKVDSAYRILLSNIIDYDYNLGVNRRDYSPAPISLTLLGGQSELLYKSETRKLFEANIYTDFIGLQEEKPNGLVQVDINKSINLNTRQRISKQWIYWLFRSYGWLHSVSPSVTISKVEQHNRRLKLNDLDSVRFNPGGIDTTILNKNIHRFTTPLDVYQYQALSAGVEVNVFNLANQDAKFEIALNVGGRLGITPLSDSLTNIQQSTINKTGFVKNYALNTIQFYPEITAIFLPEERFNLSLSNKFVYLHPFNPKIQMVSYVKNNNMIFKPVSSSWLNVLEILMTIQVNPNSKIFGRLGYTYEMRNAENNFSQIQVGYSTYILGNK